MTLPSLPTTNKTTTDPRWQLLKNAGADGQFVYAVITTGIYCRPGCSSRHPNPDNVRFFNNHIDAENAGFRACKRCHPQHISSDALQIQRIAKLCRFIETAVHEPSLAELAAYSNISTYHLQRLFKAATGLSPKAYAKARRCEQALQTPGRAKGKTTTIMYFSLGQCSLGQLLVAQNEKGICAILLGDNAEYLRADLRQRFPSAVLHEENSPLNDKITQVIDAIEQPTANLQLPLDIQGTLFQQRVWEALQKIPAGETRNYTDIARAIGSPKAVRAVAGACAANAIAVLIPCHRVVRSDGSLSGYRWGVERKQQLLQREADNTKI
ncbi:MAG: methylated-DNA--[protein]-cysteine S-methyltransferase [Pseudomonadota bacterium]|nr:methylated-DNA--[protein]-cysteine S-methyltransferase [Pseudomonadota bacterium]